MKRASLALLLMTGAGAAPAAPQGSLTYLRDQVPWLEAHMGASSRKLPHRGDVYALAVSPTTGEVAYLEALVGRNGPELPPMRGVRLTFPYTQSKMLPKPWNGVRPEWLLWSDDGRTLRARNWNGQLLTWTAPGARPAPWPLASTSHDGRVVARATDDGVVLAVGGTGERPIFTTGRSKALMDALWKQRRWPNVASFLRGYDTSQARDRRNWRFSTPAVSPDGQAVYFAANLGQGDEDMHNNFAFFVFRFNTRDGSLLALSKFGQRYGETPTLRVSPDGKRLLVVQATFISGFQEPVTVTALDLAAQTARDLTATDRKAGDLNVLKGFCWLADGQHVAYSVGYFRSKDVRRDEEEGLMPREDTRRYTLFVKDAVTGRTVHSVRGATQPGCGPR